MPGTGKTILLVGTLDTKGEEFALARSLIQARGHEVVQVDAGVMGRTMEEEVQGEGGETLRTVDVPAAQIARAGGGSLEALQAAGDRQEAMAVMVRGVAVVVRELWEAGRFHGVLGMGGGGGTALATAGMRKLPLGVPKVMLSTMASGDVRAYVDIKDLTLMHSVVDIAGLNHLTRKVIANAVGAVCGMVEQPQVSHEADRPLVAATMFGVTTPCVMAVREALEARGLGVVVFHATGSGGRAMEALIREGAFAGVVDVTTTEWADEVVGGVLSAGPERLEAAAATGLPQVVSVGALDMVNFGGVETVPERFQDRNLYRHNPTVTLMRTIPAECREIGRRVAEKLNDSVGSVRLLLPLRGVSMIDREGQPFYDPEADKALFQTLREEVDPSVVEIREVDAHVNDAAFARAVVAAFVEVLEAQVF
ncbi:MAG: Tm-1-like ATP-binding domain-containing protein [Gemmatimonadota bacterium]